MTFIGKETFREGNIWLEGGGGGLPFSPFLYAYTDDMGDPSTFTKAAAPPVPVSTEFRTWFGFTYQEDLPDTLTPEDGTLPGEFAMTVADVTVRGGAFVDYGDGNGPVALDGLAPDDPVGVGQGTSDDFPAGTSMTWRVLDAGMNVIGERTIPFGDLPGGAWTSALYNMVEWPIVRVDGRPVQVPSDTGLVWYAAPNVVWPPSLPQEVYPTSATIGQVAADGGEYVLVDGEDVLGGQSISEILAENPQAATDPIMQREVQPWDDPNPATWGIYRDLAGTDPVWEETLAWASVDGPMRIPTEYPSYNSGQARLHIHARPIYEANGDVTVTVTPATATLNVGDINLYDTWASGTGTVTFPTSAIPSIMFAASGYSAIGVLASLADDTGPAGTLSVSQDVRSHQSTFTWSTP